MADDKLLIENSSFFSEVAQMLSSGRSVTMPAVGNSMTPFIADGRDRLVLRRCTCAKVGDILLVRLPDGRHVVHRVYAREGDQLTLMGDGNRQAKEQCCDNDVIGKVTTIIRDDGRQVDCDSPAELRKAALWRRLLPVRRYLLFAYRHLKPNYKK